MNSISTAALTPLVDDPPHAVAASQLVPVPREPQWNGCGQPTAVHACALVKQRGRQVLTAVRTIDDQARLFSWRINADGAVLCTGHLEVPIGDVVQVAVAHLAHYVTACRTADGRLHLHCWDVSNTGAIYPRGAAALGANLTWFTLLPLTAQQFLTIGLNGEGRWQVTTWLLAAEAVPTPLADQTLPAVTGALAAVCLPPTAAAVPAAADPPLLVTVMHSAPNRLRWTAWQWLPDGQLVAQTQVEREVPAVIDLALTVVNGELVTLLHRAGGQLQAWRGWPPTAPVDAAATTLAQRVRLFAVINETHAQQLTLAAITAPSATQPVLVLQQWQPTAQAWQLAGAGTLPVDWASELVLCPQPLDGFAQFLTATCAADGTLHLTTWHDQRCDV